MAVFCNKCGKDVLEQSRFCPFCGVVSKRTVDGSIAFVEPEQGPHCPACGKRTVEKSKHCMWCGLDVHARPAGAGALFCPKCVEKNPEDAGFCSRCRMDFGQWFAESGDTVKLLAGRYRLGEELGRGGMGVVYKAYDTELDDIPVAIKMVPAEVAQNKNAIVTLKKEAKVAIELTHPNIARLHTFAKTGKGAFLVMEYIEGQTLEDLLQERGKLPEDEVLKTGLAILEGLAEAHKRDVIHRDLKPANIMVSRQGEVKILDFGIARVLKDTMTRLSQQAVSSSGTLLYMAPEQIKGRRETAQADIYAFGAMMYELLHGDPPFCRGAIEHQILNETPEPLEGVAPWLNEVILICLSKDPAERYSSARELANALTTGGKTGRAPPKKPARPTGDAPQESVSLPPRQPTASEALRAESLCGEAIRLEKSDKVEEALAKTREALECNSQSRSARELESRLKPRLLEMQVKQLCSEAERAFAQGEFAQALRLCSMAGDNAKGHEILAGLAERTVGRIVGEILEKGDQLFDDGAIEEAIQVWQQVEQRFPSLDKVARRLETAQKQVVELGPGGLKMREGDRLRSTGNYEEALSVYQEAEQLGVSSKDLKKRITQTRTEYSEMLVEKAREYCSHGRWRKALQRLEKAEEAGADPHSFAELREEACREISKKSRRRNIIIIAAVVVVVGIAVGWYLGVERPRALDEEACYKAREAGDKESWKSYLGEHPQGMCADQAREGIAEIERKADEASCKSARDADTEAGWKAYLGGRPEGVCKEEAKKRLEQMAAAERKRLARIEAKRKAAEKKARREKLAEETKDVKQPGMNLYWLRCPIGQRWTGSSCKGKAREMNWHKAKKACPGGYRLPTRQEFVSLLGGCDANVRGGKYGYCNKCAKSRKCRSMFGKDERYYGSSSSYAADPSYAWGVHFDSGLVDDVDKGDDNNVRCVRSGP